MEKYEVLEHVGKGSFGAVVKIRRKQDGKLLVWKEISYGKMREKEKQQLVSEVNILRELRHPNIVKYHDRIIDKGASKLYIVMEYCEKGDLGQLIKKCNRDKDFLSEDVIWKIFMQVLLALQACHNRESGKILHRDIKPGNVLLDANMNVKLGDFGLSRILGENSIYAETSVGTPYYMSPEQISDSRYNEKSDIWSAGCLLFEMASLSPPFRAKTHAELAQKIHAGQTERIPLRYSEELQRVVSWMLAVDSNLRPTVNDILNLPQINLRVREKKTRDETQRLKDLETQIKEREDKAKQESEYLKKWEQELAKKEQVFKEKKEELEGCWERKVQKIEETRKTEDKGVLKLKENTFDYLEDEKVIRRENTFQERRKEEVQEIKREKSFDYLVQEGFERAKRDSNLIEGIENAYSRIVNNKIHHNNSAPDIPKNQVSPARRDQRVSPSARQEIGVKIQHNSSAPDIPKTQISPARREMVESPYLKNYAALTNKPYTAPDIPKAQVSPARDVRTINSKPYGFQVHSKERNNSTPDIPKAQVSPARELKDSPYNLKAFKEGLEKEKNSYNIYKEIEERYKNRTSPICVGKDSDHLRLDKDTSNTSLKAGQPCRKFERIPPSGLYGNKRAVTEPKADQKSPAMRFIKKDEKSNYGKYSPSHNPCAYSPNTHSPSTHSPASRVDTKPKARSPMTRGFDRKESPTGYNYRRKSPNGYLR